METKEFIKIMSIIAESFGAEINKPTLKLWAMMFRQDNIDIEQIKQAARHIIRTRKYKGMPTYAEFYDFCKQGVDDTAQIQADIVVQQISSYGSHRSPNFDDQTTAHIMRVVFPWNSTAKNMLEKNIPFFKKDFIQAYKTYSKIEQIEKLTCNNPSLKKLAEKIGDEENHQMGEN